eukprot:gnl/MRDRNA2_/MRDRNA2_106985_c0_seq1.p1 gnl/MRDRNA2_/MRDRNA2_106985_c0~~gnl/MRDRNA2_/MRDRNA2_106985_c0_seq1.p1  ORF type:complete len:1150 (-),score=186.57 gnl/MRDRNA2_/MRDRNA2_106985_c0_seq1:7-3456(-)
MVVSGGSTLSAVTDFLLSSPTSSQYDSEAKRGCLAVALKLLQPTLDNLLGKIHTEFVAADAGGALNGTETALLKAVALLMDVSDTGIIRSQEQLLWYLAKETDWKQEQRMKALAILVKSPTLETRSLLQCALRLQHVAAVSALSVLIDAPPAATREEARQNVVIRLDKGGISKAIASNMLQILGTVMKCEPTVAALTSRLQNGVETWRRETREAVRRLVAAGNATSLKLRTADVLALRKSPRAEQLTELTRMLDVTPGKVQSIPTAIIGCLAEQKIEKAEDKSLHEAIIAALAVALDAPASTATDGGFESLARHIGAGSDDLCTAELRLLGFAALLQTDPKRDAVLFRVGKAVKGKSCPVKLGLDIMRCVILGETLGSGAVSNTTAEKLAKALQSDKDLSRETRTLVGDLLKLPGRESHVKDEIKEEGKVKDEMKVKEESKQAKISPKKEEKVKAESVGDVPGGGRFGLGLLELEKFSSDEDDNAEVKAEKDVKDEDVKQEGEDEDFDVAAYRAMLEDGEGSEEEEMDGIEDSQTDDEWDDRSISPDIEFEESEEEILAASKFEDEDNDFGFGTCGGGGLSGGLFGEEDAEADGTKPVTKKSKLILKEGQGSAIKLKRKGNYPLGAPRIVFPSLIWRGGDVLVVNKPADWICSASDVDKKKGRPLDPNEKCYNKGFKDLTDLQNYKFADREKKYIHWWSQLCHNLDEKRYSTLFDEDQNYGLCHRLDRETSGSVLFGLTDLARTQMRECFHRHYVRKMYVCLAHGHLDKKEQLIDKNLEAMGQKARLHPNGKRARTHCKVLFKCTRELEGGGRENFSFCTCEIAEGRMHQIRLHMAAGAGNPIVSEFYYQKPRQMIEDRRWCPRVFLHAYAVGMPDVSGDHRRIAISGPPGCDAGDVDQSSVTKVPDDKQEWHCCVSPIDEVLRDALRTLKPVEGDEKGAEIHANLLSHGLLDLKHENVHAMGTVCREEQIDSIFFPWSSKVNPIEPGDLGKPRDGFGLPANKEEREWEKGRRKGAKGAKGGKKGKGKRGRDDSRGRGWNDAPRRKGRGRDRSWSRGWGDRSPGRRGMARGDSRSPSWRGKGGKGDRRGLRPRRGLSLGRSRSPRRGDDFLSDGDDYDDRGPRGRYNDRGLRRGERSPKRVVLTAVDRR